MALKQEYITQILNTTKQPLLEVCELNTLQIFLAVCYCIVFVIGVFGNVLVMYVFHRQWRKGPIIELLILYLALFDLLASIFGPAVFLYWIVTCHSRWHFGWLGCKVIPTLCRVFTDISIGVILIMAIDRCRVIVFPLRRRFSRLTIHASVGLSVIMSVIWESYYINALILDEKGACYPVSVSEPTYSYPLVCLTTIRDVAFITIFSATTVAVYLRLRENSSMSLLKNSKKQSRSRSSKAMKMLVVMAVIFAVAVIPRDILHLAYTLSWIDGEEGGIPHTDALLIANDFVKLLQVSNSIYNVFIYGKMHDQFWNVVKLALKCQEIPRMRSYSMKTFNSSAVYKRNSAAATIQIPAMKNSMRDSKRGLLNTSYSFKKSVSRETEGSSCSDEI